MRLLLDTHVAIWAVLGDIRLSRNVADYLTDQSNDVFVSAISMAEIAIKWPSARSHDRGLPFDSNQAATLFDDAGFEFLDFKLAHALALRSLPLKHRDPFDRMLICQALQEPMRLITHDAIVASYSDQIIHF